MLLSAAIQSRFTVGGSKKACCALGEVRKKAEPGWGAMLE
jgi:hypothetical protein